MRNQIFFLLLSIAVLGSSCAAYLASRQTKKDNKLYVKAVANERVYPRIGERWNLDNPITQKTIYIKGKDSIIEVPVIVDMVRDSIIKAECPTLNLDSLRKALTRTVMHIRIDTFTQPDSNCIPKLHDAQLRNSNLQGKYDQQSIQLTQEQKKSSKWLWLFMAAVFAFVISWGAFIFIKTKK